MQKIVPHLWYDKEAVEAAKWYVSLFENSKIEWISKLYDTPSGDVDTVAFSLAGMEFQAISAGPYFEFTPAISIMVSCASEAEVNKLYAELSKGGSDLMPLGEYPFSKRYAWLSDRYGLNWQLYFTEAENVPKIRPCLLFSLDNCGKADEGLLFYQEVFHGSEIGFVSRYETGQAPDDRAIINYAEFLFKSGMAFVVMDHGAGGESSFNEAFSFMINCSDQSEIDYYWKMLSDVPEAEQCGWVKDKFGLSWQIVPETMAAFYKDVDEETSRRVTQTFLKMKKILISDLEAVRDNR